MVDDKAGDMDDKVKTMPQAEASSQLFLRPTQYRMGSDFDLWLSRFDNFASTIKAADRKRILLSFLDDSAYKATQNLRFDPDASYDSFCHTLRERFEPAEAPVDIQAQFLAMMQLEGQTVVDYSDCLQAVAIRAFPDMSDEARQQLLSGKFLSGLRDPTVRTQTQLTCPLQTFPSLLQTARMVEAIYAQGKITQSTALAVEEKRDVMAIDLKRMIEDLSEKVSRLESRERYGDRRTDRQRGSLTCWRCGRPGHVQRFCKNMPQGNDQGMRIAGASFRK